MNKKELNHQLRIALQKRLKSEPLTKPLSVEAKEFLVKCILVIGVVIYLINYLS